MGIQRRIQLASTLIVMAAALFAQQPAAQTPPPAATSQEDAKGQIAGTVVSAKTGEILKGVSVTVRGTRPRGQGPGPPMTRDMITGMDGRFAFTELPAGNYDLVANKAGYGGQFSFRRQVSIRLGADEARNDVVIRLQPSAVVTGRVIDAYGEPLPEAQVFALIRRALPDREPRWMTVQRAQTNDLGEYRLHSLEPGRYVLAAQAPRATNPHGIGYAEFTPSYYPGAASLDQATPLKLANGAEVSGVDFRLELSPATEVRGIVIDGSTGEPCGDCGLQISRDGVMGFDFGARPTKDGLFVIHGLQAGEHSIIVHASGRGRPRIFSEQVHVPQAGEVELKLLIGGLQTVSGEYILEGGPEPKQEQAAAAQQPGTQGQNAEPQRPMMLSLISLGPMPFPGSQGPVPPEGGPFELTDVPSGDYTIRIFGPPGGGYLRAVTLGGSELDRPRITVPRDGPVSGLKLHIAFDGAAISGIVQPASNTETLETHGEQLVIAVPDAGSNLYATQAMARVEPGGAFTFRSLPPGGYTLFAVPNPMVDFEDPEVRRVLKPYSKQVSLDKKEEIRVELTAVPESVELW
jgi:hypothetical protein